jgi:Ca2+-binding RTX toxin-like protein
LPAGVAKLTIDAGAGDDTILGSQGADVVLAGDGKDFVLSDNGNDVAFLGAGDDVVQWSPGDGSDTVEGQGGQDTLLFFGSNASEKIDLAANGGRARLFRDVAAVTMDLNDVERIDFRALGGADSIVVGDLTGTDVVQVNVDLRGPSGGGDRQADAISVNATQGSDVFGISGDAGGVTVFGLPSRTNIFFSEAGDRLTLNGLGGDDVIDATSLKAGVLSLTINGGLGADVILGSEDGDLVNGGDGNDLALLGAGSDTFVWNPGDDNDVVEGQAGTDTLLFNGANIAENIDISANNGRARFFRDIASVTMDLNDVETITFNALGGADTITVNNLAGTDVKTVAINLAGAASGGDGQVDTLNLKAGSSSDVIAVQSSSGGVIASGLAAALKVTGSEAADRLAIEGLDGNDIINASGLTAGVLSLTVDGGAGNDVITGSRGADAIAGGTGNDRLTGGRGFDTLVGNAGADIFDFNSTVEAAVGLNRDIVTSSERKETGSISPRSMPTRTVRWVIRPSPGSAPRPSAESTDNCASPVVSSRVM